MNNIFIQNLQDALAPHREALITHPLYQAIQEPEQLKRFTESHVFAVWDFMALLKGLQRALTSVDTLWIPTESRVSRRLINEIVLAEESDEDAAGNPASHFELYLDAMQALEADTQAVETFIQCLKNGASLQESLEKAQVSDTVKSFVEFTFEIIHSDSLHQLAAVFTFGREDLIPDMFTELVKDMNRNNSVALDKMIYYLDRHIELDGDEHGPMALQMMQEVCGNDPEKWEEATEASIKALKQRKALWDAVLEEISSGQPA